MPSAPIKLYHVPPSPPCRAVRLTASVIGLDLDLIFTNIMEGEHMTPEFLKVGYFTSVYLSKALKVTLVGITVGNKIFVFQLSSDVRGNKNFF